MKQVNIHEAKTHLSRIVKEVAEGGEAYVINKAGKPMVRLVPVEEKKTPRKPGAWKGKIWMSPDFDKADEEIAEMFESSSVFPE